MTVPIYLEKDVSQCTEEGKYKYNQVMDMAANIGTHLIFYEKGEGCNFYQNGQCHECQPILGCVDSIGGCVMVLTMEEQVYLYGILLHELGHILGLTHTDHLGDDYRYNVMWNLPSDKKGADIREDAQENAFNSIWYPRLY